MNLSDPISLINGIGSSREEVLKERGIETVGDVLNYLPYTYQDSTNLLQIEDVFEIFKKYSVWEIPNERFAVRALIEKKTAFKTRRGFSIINVTLSQVGFDKRIRAIWFNQDYLVSGLIEGEEYIFYGKLKLDKGTLIFQSPQFENIHNGAEPKVLNRVTPIYRRIKKVTTKMLEKYPKSLVAHNLVIEFITPEVLKEFSIASLPDSYKYVHIPEKYSDTMVGRRRIEIQELLELKEDFEEYFTGSDLPISKSDLKVLLEKLESLSNQLPFTLTDSQSHALSSITDTLKTGKRLDTFVYGDVGSGKTIVSLLFAFAFAHISRSSILIAPTTILAKQHVENAKKLVENLGLSKIMEVVHVVSGKEKVTNDMSKPVLYIGTHAILFKKSILEREDIQFVCIDEQHRFGVEQRMQLDPHKKRHVITLSATPIPRTLALSFLGFAQSVDIASKPVGRKDIITKVVPFDKEEVTYQWIRRKVDAGEKVFLVFPRIEDEDDVDSKKSLLSATEQLTQKYFSGLKYGVLYGELKDEEKNNIMEDFSSGKTQLLFSTSVIEVGVDIPDATIIAIHGAEMFGLAQLHQLRGRVGRSDLQSYCFVFPGDYSNENGLDRLNFFSNHLDGISLAEYDLDNRGMGTLAGLEQSGLSELKIASFSNLALLKDAMEIYSKLKEQKVEIVHYIR